MGTKPKRDDGCVIIFRPYITTRNGERIYASSFGKKAFPIYVKTSTAK